MTTRRTARRVRRTVVEGFTTELALCTHCGEETDLADLDEIEHTWQQWRCQVCGAWNDNPSGAA